MPTSRPLMMPGMAGTSRGRSLMPAMVASATRPGTATHAGPSSAASVPES
ncbi:MAG: hypothetical protein HKP12_08590 [Gammaproteobacteria bacterium]|nr:hypothetical protein [Gammaproteobacteria bacterium]